jgi:hypothetical protein
MCNRIKYPDEKKCINLRLAQKKKERSALCCYEDLL